MKQVSEKLVTNFEKEENGLFYLENYKISESDFKLINLVGNLSLVGERLFFIIRERLDLFRYLSG